MFAIDSFPGNTKSLKRNQTQSKCKKKNPYKKYVEHRFGL